MVILCVCVGTVQYWWISIGLVIVLLRAVFCPSVQYLSLFCEAFSSTILDSSSFPLFDSAQLFHKLYALLLMFFLRFSSVSLHCSPIHNFFTCRISIHGRCHDLPRLNEFSGFLLTCFTLPCQTSRTEVLLS